MKIITVVNDTLHLGFNLLRLSCVLNDLQLIVLVSRSDFTSNRIKDELLADYISEMNDNEIILFTDGNDAVLLASETEILNKFFRTNADLVFSTEVNCWPDNSLYSSYPNNSSSPYRYLNSGGFIGKIGYIKQVLNDCKVDKSKFIRSNQYLWTQRYLNNKDKIFLDTNCELFSTFNATGLTSLSNDLSNDIALLNKWFDNNFAIENQRIYSKRTNTYPCHGHFNGFSKILIKKHIIEMVYEQIGADKKAQFFYE
jgi:hypothetical protein